jgi:hypothetical protein
MNEDYLQDLWNRRQALKLRALSNRLYQQDRWRLLERREGMVKVASLLAGSVALSRVLDPTVVNACVAVIFAGTSASLVFGWSAKARDASRRAADWTALERDIEAAGERQFTEQQLDAWTGRAAEIEAGEAGMNRALYERAYARACEALGLTPVRAATWWELHRPVVLVP